LSEPLDGVSEEKAVKFLTAALILLLAGLTGTMAKAATLFYLINRTSSGA
jgi:hypothetical protein